MRKFIAKLLVAILPVTLPGALTVGFTATAGLAETTECTEIPSLPFVIDVQGVYCFKHNLVTDITFGNAITVNTNNVTIDLNGFKLGGSAAGTGTQANGIAALNRKNVVVRNGTIRGFFRGIWFNQPDGSGHLVENIRADGNTYAGIAIAGDNIILRNNHIINTGPTDESNSAFGILANSVRNTLIADNTIKKVSETSSAFGIYIILDSANVEVRGNSIFEMKDAVNNYGMAVDGSQMVIRDNVIINPAATGATGISGFASVVGLGCIRNITVGYASANSNCDFNSGNLNY